VKGYIAAKLDAALARRLCQQGHTRPRPNPYLDPKLDPNTNTKPQSPNPIYNLAVTLLALCPVRFAVITIAQCDAELRSIVSLTYLTTGLFPV